MSVVLRLFCFEVVSSVALRVVLSFEVVLCEVLRLFCLRLYQVLL